MKRQMTYDEAITKILETFRPGEACESYFGNAEATRASAAFRHFHTLYVAGKVSLYRLDDNDVLSPCPLDFDAAVADSRYRLVMK